MANVGSSLRPAMTAIEQRVRDRWVTGDLQLLTPVKFADKPLLECATGTMPREPENSPWLAVDVLFGGAENTSIGGGAQNRLTGFVQLTLYYPRIFTSAPSSQFGLIDFADLARMVFDNWEGSSLRFDAASGPENRDELDATSKWKVRVITINFDLHECAS